MKSHWIITIVLVVIVGAGAFFGGMQYANAQRAAAFGQGNFQGGRRFGFGGNTGMRPVRGQILSADATTMTVKLADGSSKIIVLSGSTSITEATSAGKEALQNGKEVVVFGTQNSDGSVTAQNIQLNPLQMRGGSPAPTQ